GCVVPKGYALLNKPSERSLVVHICNINKVERLELLKIASNRLYVRTLTDDSASR
nr:hypothetical protein [Tanacetum cinerariifolium]